jgi:hypothetical protein
MNLEATFVPAAVFFFTIILAIIAYRPHKALPTKGPGPPNQEPDFIVRNPRRPAREVRAWRSLVEWNALDEIVRPYNSCGDF